MEEEMARQDKHEGANGAGAGRPPVVWARYAGYRAHPAQVVDERAVSAVEELVNLGPSKPGHVVVSAVHNHSSLPRRLRQREA